MCGARLRRMDGAVCAPCATARLTPSMLSRVGSLASKRKRGMQRLGIGRCGADPCADRRPCSRRSIRRFHDNPADAETVVSPHKRWKRKRGWVGQRDSHPHRRVHNAECCSCTMANKRLPDLDSHQDERINSPPCYFDIIRELEMRQRGRSCTCGHPVPSRACCCYTTRWKSRRVGDECAQPTRRVICYFWFCRCRHRIPWYPAPRWDCAKSDAWPGVGPEWAVRLRTERKRRGKRKGP